MKRVSMTVGSMLALLLISCAGVSQVQPVTEVEEFIGTTACDPLPREFLGGFSMTDPCHCIIWKLKLSPNQNWKLTAIYGLPSQANSNVVANGPTVELRGTWQKFQRPNSSPKALVYRLTTEKPERSLSLIKLGNDLLHVLDAKGNLSVGNAGWGYTLSRKGAGVDQ